MPDTAAQKSETRVEVSFSSGVVRREGDLVRCILEASAAHGIDEAKSLIDAIGQVAERDKPVLLLTDVCATSVGPDREARAYYTTDEAGGYARRSALLVTSIPQKLMGNFFAIFGGLKVPFKVFTDEDAALAWLRDGE